MKSNLLITDTNHEKRKNLKFQQVLRSSVHDFKKKSHSFKVQTHVEFFTEYFLVFIVIVEKELK